MKNNKGFTLLLAVITTSILLLVSFVVINVATKQLFIGESNQQSQYAFYNTDSGSECAIFWDLKKSPSPFLSAGAGNIPFACGTSGAITPVTVLDGATGISTSTFTFNLTKGCATIDVVKRPNGTTKVSSKGYNNCAVGAQRRYERAIEINY